LAVLLLGLVAGVVFGCADDVESRLDDARAREAAGNTEGAIAILQQVVAENPDHPETNFLLGRALVQTRRPRLAIAPLEVATQSDEYVISAGLLLASTQLQLDLPDDAIRTTDRVLAVDPENLTALFTRGQSFLASNRPKEAIELADQILALKPDAQNATVLKGSALVSLGLRDEAERLWQELRRTAAESGNPNRAASACVQLALFYRTQGENDHADTIYTECLEQFPNHAFLQRSASNFYLRNDQPERAVDIYRRAVEAEPDDIRNWSRLAGILMLHGDVGDAESTLRQVVERFDSPEAWRLFADYYRKTRNTTEARKALEQAINRSEAPQEAFLYSLADLLVDEGDLDRAREIGSQLTEPSYRHLLDGAIDLKSGAAEQALEELTAGLALWPQNPRAHYLAGQAALSLHERKRAVEEFTQAVRISDSATDAALELAAIAFARTNYSQALTFAQRQISQRPYLDATPYHIAIRSALELSQPERAKQLLAALREADPRAIDVVVEEAAIQRAERGAEASSGFILSSGRDLAAPENEPLLQALAEDLESLDRPKEALRYIDAALARNGDAAATHDLRARALSRLNRLDEARSATRRALEIEPELAAALETQGFLALQAGDRPAALVSLDAAAAAAPLDANLAYLAASLAGEMGDSAGAVTRLEETLARQPSFGPAANDLAWILATNRSDLNRALVLARIAVHQTRSSAALATLGWVHHQRGEFEDAIENYRAALEANHALPAVQYRLGLSLAATGQVEEALQLLNGVVKGPAFPEIDAARAELARIKGS
jgi:tetratricopeptide (TPR) repeat protein